MVKKLIYLLAVPLILALLWRGMSEGGQTKGTRVFPSAAQGIAIPVTGPEAFQGCRGSRVELQRADFEQRVVELTNQVRIEQGLPPLKRVLELDEAARYHAADMSHDNYFDHNTFDRDSNGGLVASCDTWKRMEQYYTLWNAMGENIAAGQRSPEMAIDGWMNSPEHYENMMSSSYWEIGSGFYSGEGSFRYYWDQNFGRRSGVFPVILNNEAAQTSSQLVSAYVYGDWREARVRVDQGPWSEWVDFQRQFPVVLPNVAGTHTVVVEMRTFALSAQSSDTIELAEQEVTVMSQFLSPFLQTP